MSRAEVAALSDLHLDLARSGAAHRLRRAWDAGRPGSTHDVYLLALTTTEVELRRAEVVSVHPGQLQVFQDEADR